MFCGPLKGRGFATGAHVAPRIVAPRSAGKDAGERASTQSGAALGGVVTAVFAGSRDWPFALPLWVLAGAAGATILIGMLAGAYPAARAARMSPTAALATV